MLNNIAALTNSGAAAVVGDYESIATVTVGAGGSSTITFSSIAGTYSHLQLRMLARSTFVRGAGSTTPVNMYMKIGNGGTIQSTNYSYHGLQGDGASATSFAQASATSMFVAAPPGANAAANIFGDVVLDILDYTSTSKNKTIRSLAGVDQNGVGQVALLSASYFGTPLAITDIQITTDSNFAQYSSFALYGVK